MAMPKDDKIYDDALTLALQNIMGRGKASFIEAMLGLHWALARKLWQSGKNAGIEEAMSSFENIELTNDNAPKEDTTPKGLRRPPPREKKPKKGKK